MAMPLQRVQVAEVKPGDVFADLRVTVAFSEPFSDHLWALECNIEGTNGQQTVTMVLPNEHHVRVSRL